MLVSCPASFWYSARPTGPVAALRPLAQTGAFFTVASAARAGATPMVLLNAANAERFAGDDQGRSSSLQNVRNGRIRVPFER